MFKCFRSLNCFRLHYIKVHYIRHTKDLTVSQRYATPRDFAVNVCSQTSFYIFVNQIVCVDAKCTCLMHSMLHMVVITNDSLKCSTRISLTIRPVGNFSHVFTGEVSIALL